MTKKKTHGLRHTTHGRDYFIVYRASLVVRLNKKGHTFRYSLL